MEAYSVPRCLEMQLKSHLQINGLEICKAEAQPGF